jgi:hypothetical protein
MFEATFKIAALVTSNEQGQRVFQVLKRGEPVDDDGFFSLVAMIYQQDVYRTLRVDDDLTVTVHLDLPPRDIERTLRFREDGRFEGEGIVEPTADLLPLISSMSEHFGRQVQSGDVPAANFSLQQLYYKLLSSVLRRNAGSWVLTLPSQFMPGCWRRPGQSSRGLVSRDLLRSPSPASLDSTGYCRS